MKRTRPRELATFLRWSVAMIGLLLTLTIALLARYSIWRTNRQLIHDELTQKLLTYNHFQAQEIANKLFQPPKVLSLTLPVFDTAERKKIQVAVQKTFEIIALTGQRKLSDAHDMFISLCDQQLEAFSLDSSQGKELKSLMNKIEAGFLNLFKDQKQQEINIAAQRRLLQERNTILQRQKLLLRELERLKTAEQDISETSLEQADEQENHEQQMNTLLLANQAVIEELDRKDLEIKEIDKAITILRKDSAKMVSRLLRLLGDIVLLISRP